MKLSLIFLATGALAASLDHRSPLLYARQDAVVSDIKAIEDAVKAAGSSLDGGDYKKLASDFTAVLDSLDKATSAAKGLSTLPQEQALTLAQPAQSLSKTTVTVLKDVSSKKAEIVKAGYGGAVYAGLQEAQTKAGVFVKTLVSKIPTSLSTVANGIVQPAITQLDTTVNDFKDAGKSGGGGSEESAPSTPSSVAAAAPAASTPEPEDTTSTEDTTPSTDDTSAPTEEDAAASSPASTPAVYGPPPSTNTTTNTTSTSSAPPETYTGAAASVFAMGPAALAAAAIVAVAAL